MTAEIFTRRWLGLFALLAGLVVFAPFLVQAVVANSTCGEVSGRCVAMGGALDLYARWLIIGVVLVPLLLAVAGRSLAVGMFAFAFPFTLLAAAGAIPLLLALGDVTQADFLERAGVQQATTQFLLLLVTLVCLSVAGDDHHGASGAWKALIGFVMLAGGFVSAPSWLSGLATLPYLSHLTPPLATFFAQAHHALDISDMAPMLQTQALVGLTLGSAGLMFSRDRAATPVRKRSWA